MVGARAAQGDPDRVKDRNLIRSSITQYFPDRLCFTLKRPVNDEKLLQVRAAAPGSAARARLTPRRGGVLGCVRPPTPPSTWTS